MLGLKVSEKIQGILLIIERMIEVLAKLFALFSIKGFPRTEMVSRDHSLSKLYVFSLQYF